MTQPTKEKNMHLNDLIDPAELQLGIDAKLITVRDSGDGHLIYNYSDAALYTPGAWDNPAVRQCRGLITDTDGNIIARPWAKFFNHNQPEAGLLDLDAPVEVTDKLDGSLGIIHRAPDGQLRVATRGSFLSDQAIHATQWLRSTGWDLFHIGGITPLVEIIYPANRIVCNYGDTDELRLLGAVVINTGRYLGPHPAALACNWLGKTTEVYPYTTLYEALAAPPRPGAEGLCVRYLHEPRIVKIKQDDYVALHRIVTGLSERTVWQHMVDGKAIAELLEPLPDELHQWTHDVWWRLIDRARATTDAADAVARMIRNELGPDFDRRDYAERAKQYGPLTPLLFQWLDGRDLLPAILKTLKPAGDTRAKTVSEATA